MGDETELNTWLSTNYPSTNSEVKPSVQIEANTWKEIRLFLSSTFVDTHAERDVIVKRVIPSINRKMAPRFIRVTPVDLRWGVLAEESKDCEAIQKTCLNQLEKCRQDTGENPWFLGLRTNRYGWIQDKLTASERFEQPEQCEWIDKFDTSCKNVSITSLECIHAALPPKTRMNAPTVFFYERDITNSSDIEHNLRWLFDFEYVPRDTELDAEIQYQYVKTDDALTYEKDKKSLDEYLKSLPHVQYSTYTCRYEKGGARITCKRENNKSFGVGYVSGLAEFEEKIESDLLKTIEENFKVADASGVSEDVIHNTQHENAVKQKASMFVGRSQLYEQCLEHVSSKHVTNCVMIIHGEPGCGKSALLAAVSKNCLSELRSRGDFVFVHSVDSCPGSNNIEDMLKNLQVSLRKYRISMGESGISQQCSTSPTDLKSAHLMILEETAKKYRRNRFVILIDAVNQFHGNLQAWTMWWLPSDNAPTNLRVVISTLNKENGTFENACSACPNAIKVPVINMSYNDREMMVTAYLARYNKKLTTSNDKVLGNQVDSLLRKSDSPLYLMAATEAVRKFGIYEEVTKYILNLPNTIAKLFTSLLDEWSKEYGEKFTTQVTGLICVSKDGLLENQINDLLSFKENADGVLYDCSFSRLYDSLCSFLASGGGGYLRYFHDQLKFAVRDKFLTAEVEKGLHSWLVEFYLSCIHPQLCENPALQPPVYYESCLQQVVYHQLQQRKESVDFTSTLRNVYFVRERVTHQQDDLLQQEYIAAIRQTNDISERKALQQWSKFSQFYSPLMKKCPEWCYNMAINQPTSSQLYIDTNNHPEPTPCDGYPLYWTNIPSEEDPVALKYATGQAFSCVASTIEKNIICTGGRDKAFLYEMDSGVRLHRVDTTNAVWSVYLSTKFNTFWTGDEGDVTVWSVETGLEEWRICVGEDGVSVIWMENVGDFVACGTTSYIHNDYNGIISIIDEEKRSTVRSWSTKSFCCSFRYHNTRNLILSGHKNGLVKCWSVGGNLMKSIKVGGEKMIVRCLTLHPTKQDVITVVVEWRMGSYTVKHTKLPTGEEMSSIPGTYDATVEEMPSIPGTGRYVLYDTSGERIICWSGDMGTQNTVLIYSEGGQLQNRIKGNTDTITNICLVPGTDDLLTSAQDQSMLLHLPSTPDQVLGEDNIKEDDMTSCQFLPGGSDEFFTMSSKGKLQFWLTPTCKRNQSVNMEGGSGVVVQPDGDVRAPKQLCCFNTVNLAKVSPSNVFSEDKDDWTGGVKISRAVDVRGGRGAVVHPDGKYIVVYATKQLHWLSTVNLEEVTSCTVLPEDDRGRILDVKISEDGTKCVVAIQAEGTAHVYDITNINDMKTIVSYSMRGYMTSLDIHRDSERAVSAGHGGIHMWCLHTGKLIRKLLKETNIQNSKPEYTFYVNFLHASDRILYVDRNHRPHIMDMQGVHLVAFDSRIYKPTSALKLLRNETQLITGDESNTLRLHDTNTGKVLYTFYNHRSEGFYRFAEHPSNNLVIAFNLYLQMYV